MKFEQIKDILVAAAQRAGLEEYEIYYNTAESVSAETLKNEISTFASDHRGGVCFRCIVDGKMGYASGELMTPDALEELVENAVSNAACIDSEDEVFIFAGSPSYAKLPEREIKLADAGEIRKAALELQKEVYETHEWVCDGTQSGALSEVSEVYLYNSKGLNLSNRTGVGGCYAQVVMRKGEEAENGFAFAADGDIKARAELAKKVTDETADRFGAGLVESGKYKVLMSGKTMRDFLATFSSVFSAKNAQLGLSLLAGKEGTAIASEKITITDDPMREGTPMQTSFDGEGVATARRNVVEGGVLKTLLYDLTTAKKAGVESTGNGQKGGYASAVSIAPYNFSIAAGDTTEEALFAAAGDGIYVTECKGFHAGANPVTGDFSIESAGFRIRDGKRAEPIKSFTVSGNFFEFLKQVALVGNEVRWGMPFGFTVFGSPDILFDDVSIAGE